METIIQRSNLLKNPTPPIDDDNDYIPDWLLFEILIRLPIKSIFRFRVVSKRWLSVASAPYFIGAYASRASSSSSWIVLPLFVYPAGKILPAFVHNPSNNLIPCLHSPQRSFAIQQETEIIGVSDDGLVLYCAYDRNQKLHLYVCNPITGDQIEPVTLQLPCYRLLGWGFVTSVDGEFTLKSYRIVRAMQNPDDTAVIFYVYYSEMGDWRRFMVALGYKHRHVLQNSAAVLDSVLYWADMRGGGVIAYDPEAKPPEQQVRFLRVPHGSERWSLRTCVAYRGELRYFGGRFISYSGIPRFSIWKLEQGYCGAGEWRLVHKIEEESIMMDNRGALGIDDWLGIVHFDPFDSDVVCLITRYGRSFFSYNFKSGMTENKESFSFSRSIFPLRHVLVLPPWPTRVAEKQLERR